MPRQTQQDLGRYGLGVHETACVDWFFVSNGRFFKTFCTDSTGPDSTGPGLRPTCCNP